MAPFANSLDIIRAGGPVEITANGVELIEHPLLNKDTAFTENERDLFGLRGFLPSQVQGIAEQAQLEMEHVRRKEDDLEKYIGLAALQDRNETLFYRVLADNIEELMPIVYTPVVGRACQRFSHIFRRPRGLWITPADVGRIEELFRNARTDKVRLIVVTDNERILGLGDQGAGGMGIPVGKLSLYTAGAGIYPSLTLPVSLDVGTDNADLLADPLYLGYRAPRLRGEAYDDFIEAFIQAVLAVFPHCAIQWEDFKQHNAIRILDRYRRRITSFNDDIQGTAGVVVAGFLAASKKSGEPLGAQRFMFLGSGASGIGIARLTRAAIQDEGKLAAGERPAIAMLDSSGLIFEGRKPLDEDKKELMLTRDDMQRYGFEPAERYDFETAVHHFKPTVLVGVTGQPGAFTEKAIRAMAEHTKTPVVFPLSNPTSKCEAVPADILAWTEGRALIATGSPFEPVTIDGKTHVAGQANNVFIFPGVGLGIMVSEARQVTDSMFLVAAKKLAEMVGPDRLRQGALYPPQDQLRRVSRDIAIAVVREARAQGVGRAFSDDEIRPAVESAMWEPNYAEYVRPEAG